LLKKNRFPKKLQVFLLSFKNKSLLNMCCDLTLGVGLV